MASSSRHAAYGAANRLLAVPLSAKAHFENLPCPGQDIVVIDPTDPGHDYLGDATATRQGRAFLGAVSGRLGWILGR